MRLVSDNSDKKLAERETERAKQWAKDGMPWPLRELAANLMRITRGAGKPEQLGTHIGAVVQAFEEYRSAFGYYPLPDEISAALRTRDNEVLGRWKDWDYALYKMMRGGLQIAASSLLHQGTQRSAGEDELFDGLATIERIREENRLGAMRRPAPRKRRPKK